MLREFSWWRYRRGFQLSRAGQDCFLNFCGMARMDFLCRRKARRTWPSRRQLVNHPKKLKLMGEAVRALQTNVPTWENFGKMTVEFYRAIGRTGEDSVFDTYNCFLNTTF